MDEEADSKLMEVEEQLSTESFYGKKIDVAARFNPFVKMERLPDAVCESYDKRLSLSDVDSNGSKVPTRRNENKVLLGSQATRHNVKRRKKTVHGIRGYRQSSRTSCGAPNYRESTKSEDETGSVNSLSTESEEMNEKTRLKETKNKVGRRKRASTVSTQKKAKINNMTRWVDLAATMGRRIIPKREASALVAKKIAMANDSPSEDDDPYIRKIKFYQGKRSNNDSEFSESDDTSSNSSNNKPMEPSKVVQKKKVGRPPKPKFSDYEKAAQEKVALRLKFLKSLNVPSSDEDL